MSIPTQRGPETDGTGRVLSYVAESLRRLEDSVGRLSSDMNAQMSRMPEFYVPRREVERRFDELTVDLGAEQSARKSDVARLADRLDSAETARRAAEEAAEQAALAGRRWLIGVLLTSCALILSLLGFVATHLT